MSEITFPAQPKIESIPEELRAIAKDKKITNIILSFLDFHITEEAYSELKAADFKNSNLLQTISDLDGYGYSVTVPETAEEFRAEIYPSIIELHAKAGYYGIQIPVGGVYFDDSGMLTEKSIELLKRQKDIIESTGMVPSAVGGYWVADWTQCIKPHIQASNVLGSPYIYGPFATPFLYFPEGASSGEAAMDWVDVHIEKFAKLLQEEIGPFAAKYGVTICDEPLQRFERMPIRLKEAVGLALKANIDQFKIMVDMCHEFADGDGPVKFRERLKRLHDADKLHGIHISAVHRGKLYESWFNQQYFNEFFTPYFELGYDGEISIETFDATEPVVETAKVNRRIFKNPIGVMINQLVYSADKLSKVPILTSI